MQLELPFTDERRAELEQAMRDSAKNAAPYEMCGAIVKNDAGVYFIEMTNGHADPENYFKLRAEDLAHIEDNHEIIAIAHSHPKHSAELSAMDVYSSRLHNKPFVVVSHDGEVIWHPVPSPIPLLGREYVHDVVDCFTIVRDYFARELGININDFERKDGWWRDPDHPSLYLENFEKEGFVRVPKEDLRRNDVLLVRLGETAHVNHALIYLADDGKLKSEQTPDCIGKTLYLHHPHGGLSVRKILGNDLYSKAEYVVRHRSLL